MREIIENLFYFRFGILRNSKILLAIFGWFTFFSLLPVIGLYLPISLLNSLTILQLKFLSHLYWFGNKDLVFFFIWIISFFLFKELVERYLLFKKNKKMYSLSKESWSKDWIFNGKPKLKLNPLTLYINSNRAGCILDNYLWKKFEMSFDLKFEEYDFNWDSDKKHIGVIFAAEDLENYFMLELIVKKDDKKTGKRDVLYVKPHVRYLGMWEGMSEDEIGSTSSSEEWMHISLTLDGDEVNVSFQDMENYSWYLPTHVDINHIEDGVKRDSSNTNQSGKEFSSKTSFLPKIEFKDKPGRIGFRAHIDQGGYIRNLNIREI